MNATRIKAGGFNLLPHRQRDARLARRRRYIEWTAAALCGCVGVAALVAWQAFERTSIDGQRAELDRKLATLASPLAEHARLTGEGSNERLQNARAATLSEPLVHLLDLLDALSQEPSEAVVVKQLRQRGRDTEMFAASTDHAAASAWLNRLAALRGVKDASLSDLHRTASAMESSAAIELTANLKWDGPAEKPKASAAAHQKTRGEK
ncbi:fimbrial assembly protein [Paraburkholderia diazotrophica]|uniref:fimbrial assembly protein n=1 Tax=Paraburkholderia diazotrophica TaxID=667676 RepID=UPI00316D99BA